MLDMTLASVPATAPIALKSVLLKELPVTSSYRNCTRQHKIMSLRLAPREGRNGGESYDGETLMAAPRFPFRKGGGGGVEGGGTAQQSSSR